VFRLRSSAISSWLRPKCLLFAKPGQTQKWRDILINVDCSCGCPPPRLAATPAATQSSATMLRRLISGPKLKVTLAMIESHELRNYGATADTEMQPARKNLSSLRHCLFFRRPRIADLPQHGATSFSLKVYRSRAKAATRKGRARDRPGRPIYFFWRASSSVISHDRRWLKSVPNAFRTSWK